MAQFLQWNCRGVTPRFNDLKCLIDKHKPKCICLQELILVGNKTSISDFHPPLLSVQRGDNDRGGAGIFIHKSVIFSTINLQIRLHAAAARLHLDRHITVCSLYLAPSCPYTERYLNNLFQQLPSPVLILMDFNILNPLWGDSEEDAMSNSLIDLMDTYSLGCLNSGLSTFERLSVNSFTSSCIDVSLCSNSVQDRLEWSREEELWGSDHFPILIKGFRPPPRETDVSTEVALRPGGVAGFLHRHCDEPFCM